MQEKVVKEMIEGKGLTPFQVKVLCAVAAIKKGEVRTYKDIASSIGHRNAYRAVGTAVANNPFPVTIPCHRVVKSTGEIGNYSAGGQQRKIALLKSEGIQFNGTYLA